MRFAIAELLERTQRGGSESLIALLYRFLGKGIAVGAIELEESMESPSSRLRKLSRSGGEDVREVGGGGDVESFDNKSAVVQNSGSEEGEEVIGRRRGMVEEMNLQGKLRGLLRGLTGTAGKEFLSGYSVAEDNDDEESSGSEGSGSRGGLDRSLGGRKTVFPRKVVLKRHSGHGKGDAKMDDFKKASPTGATHTNRNVSKVVRQPKRRKQHHSRHLFETEHHDDPFDHDESTSPSDSESSSSDSENGKREVSNKKRRKVGEDKDGNVTWNAESVRVLFETYNTIYQQLCEQNKGLVKYQKKWTFILQVLRKRFGQHFTKKQCQSKYWFVQRECSDYRYMSAKMAQTDPFWNPSIAGRELLKPKFYDVWYDVSGRNQAITKTRETTRRNEKLTSQASKSSNLRCQGSHNSFAEHQAKDCDREMREMQQLMQIQLQASEKREEGMKNRAELMMELLTQHMEHVEKRVGNLEESRQPQLQLLERINNKLEKVLDGFSTLNENLSIISSCISNNLDS